MLITLSIVMGFMILVYLVVVLFGFLNVNTFLVKQGRYKNYFMLSFYTMSQICLVARIVEWAFFFVQFIVCEPELEYYEQPLRVNETYKRALNTM